MFVKKWLIGLLILMLVAIPVFGACAAPAPAPAPAPSPAPAPAPKPAEFPLPGWPKGVVCNGGSPGSDYYSIMTAIAELSSKYLKVKGTVVSSPAGSGPIIESLIKGETDFGACADLTMNQAILGIGPYEGRGKNNNMRAVVGSHTTLFSIVTDAKYGVKTIADLKGSKYYTSLKPQASTLFCSIVDHLLEFYGIDPAKDITEVPHSSKFEAFDGLREGRFKVIVEGGPGRGPSAYWLEMDMDIDMRMVPLSEECIKYIGEHISGVVPVTVAPGIYKGVPEGCTSVGICTAIYCQAELPEDYVYEICKLVLEQPGHEQFLSYGGVVHEEYTTERVDYLLSPYHAAAVKYYKEKGVWTDKAEKQQKEILAKMGVEK